MPTTRSSKTAGACGLGFVAFAAAAFVLENVGAPSGDTVSNAKLVSYLTDHKDGLQGAAVLMALGGLLFLGFLGGLRERLERGGARATVPIAAGALFVGGLFTYAALKAAIPQALDYAKPYTVDTNTARVLEPLSYTSLIYVSIAAAAMVIGVSYIAAGHGLLPSWLTRGGYGAAALSVVSSVAFIPLGPPLAGVWVVAVSIVMLRDARVVPAANAERGTVAHSRA